MAMRCVVWAVLLTAGAVLFLSGLAAGQEMELVQVQVVTRHGARVPYQIVATDPTEWNCDLHFISVPNVGESLSEETPPRLYRKTYLPGQEVFKGNCSQGELLGVGAQQHFELGEHYRELYVDTGFLPSEYSRRDVFIRSTDVTRTVKCAESFMLGMFPPANTNCSVTELIDIHVVESSTEYIEPASDCQRMIADCNAIQLAPDFLKKWEAMLPLQAYLQDQWNITAAEFPWWGGVRNTLESRQAAGKPLPPYFNQSMVDQIDEFCDFEMTALYRSQNTQRLGIGRFTQHLLNNMKREMAAPGLPRFFLYSGHDITLGLLTSSFQVFDGVWPAFASHFAIELHKDDSSNYYVRLVYNSELRIIPGCEEFCPFDTVSDMLLRVIPTNFEEECNVVGGASPMNQLTQFLCTA